MPVVTATEITVLTGVSASAATITSSGRIPIVQERICEMTGNQFVTDLYLEDSYTFNATARTILASGGDFLAQGFVAGYDVYVYGSHLNDGHYQTLTVTSDTITLATGESVIDELSGASIIISVVRWPKELKQTAAEMVAYDTDARQDKAANVRSRSMGPVSESYSDTEDEFGYPKSITEGLVRWRIARSF